MLEHFTDEEIERMSDFTETPTYEREPEQLLPEDADDGEDAPHVIGPASHRP